MFVDRRTRSNHLITGLYDGKMDHAPVLAICGQAEGTVRGASYQQELNLDRTFADVAGFVQEASSPRGPDRRRASGARGGDTEVCLTVSPPRRRTASRNDSRLPHLNRFATWSRVWRF